MNRHTLSFLASFIVVIALTVILCGCSEKSNVPSQFIGHWSEQVNRNQRVEVSIEKNGDYKLKIIETNKKKEYALYTGKVITVNENIIKMPSTSYVHEQDKSTFLVSANSTFFLRSDGAFSKTEAGLDHPYGYLVK